MLYKVKRYIVSKEPLPHLKPLFSTPHFFSQYGADYGAFKMATVEILGVVLLMTSNWACVLREESFCAANAFLSAGCYRPWAMTILITCSDSWVSSWYHLPLSFSACQGKRAFQIWNSIGLFQQLNVASPSNAKSLVNNPSLSNQLVSSNSIDGHNWTKMRKQKLKDRMDRGQLSPWGNGKRFHYQMGPHQVASHLYQKIASRCFFFFFFLIVVPNFHWCYIEGLFTGG